IISCTSRAKEMKLFIENEVLVWKHKCGLSGDTYDSILPCYGNPNASLVFIAEIANFSPAFRNCQEWQKAWNLGKGDKTLREALHGTGFIPEGDDDGPWNWNCWLTNVAKCAEEDKKWKELRKEKKDEPIVVGSLRLLRKELQIISPKVVVLMGAEVQRYYRFDVEDEMGSYKIEDKVDALDVPAPHYSARMNRETKARFNKRIYKISKLVTSTNEPSR
ncbi:MAG: uracil-DNA glycosylase family protein, partial [Nitrososphaerales archaeon]